MSKGRVFLGREGSSLQVVSCFALLLTFASSAVAEEKIAVKTDGVEVKFSALTQIWGTVPFSKEFTFGSYNNAMTFKLRRAELGFSGKIYGEKINWTVLVDPAERPSDPLQDLYINLNFIPKTEFRIGQFRIPLSMEGQMASAQLDFAERTLVVRLYSDRRDVGAMFSGRFGRWEWQAAAFNGNGQNFIDNNNFKDLAGRIAIKPANFLHIGGSGYWAKRTIFDYGDWPPKASYALDSFRVAGELKIDYSDFNLRAEAIWSADEAAAYLFFPFSGMKTYYKYAWGGYASFLYSFAKKHQLGTRLEWFDPDPSAPRTALIIPTFGYTFFLSEHAKWQLNFQSQVQRRGQLENQDTYFVLTNLQVSF